jgi:hypothetical protein
MEPGSIGASATIDNITARYAGDVNGTLLSACLAGIVF